MRRRRRKGRWFDLLLLTIVGGFIFAGTGIAVAVNVFRSSPSGAEASCNTLTDPAITTYQSQIEAATRPALTFDESFPSAVDSAIKGTAAGNFAWGAVSYRNSIDQVLGKLNSIKAPNGMSSTLDYYRIALRVYNGASDALIAAAHANTVSSKAGLLDQGKRLNELGDNIFDRGRAIEAVRTGGAVTIPGAVPNFSQLGQGPHGSVLVPQEETTTTEKALLRVLDHRASAVQAAMDAGDRKSLDELSNQMAISAPANGCLTEFARAARESVVLAGEAAWDQSLGPQDHTLVSYLESLSVQLWNTSAKAGGFRLLDTPK